MNQKTPAPRGKVKTQREQRLRRLLYAVTAMFALSVGLDAFGYGVVQKAQGDALSAATSAKNAADTLQGQTDQVNRVALYNCKGLEQIRTVVLHFGDTIIAQPAQLVDPAARLQRTTTLRKILKPLVTAQEQERQAVIVARYLKKKKAPVPPPACSGSP